MINFLLNNPLIHVHLNNKLITLFVLVSFLFHCIIINLIQTYTLMVDFCINIQSINISIYFSFCFCIFWEIVFEIKPFRTNTKHPLKINIIYQFSLKLIVLN